MEGESLPNPLGTKLILQVGESIKFVGKGLLLPGARPGTLLITDRRLIFHDASEGHISLERTLDKLTGIDVEKNVQVGKTFRDMLRLAFDRTILFDIRSSSPPNHPLGGLVEMIQKLRLREILRENAGSIGDFALLMKLLSRLNVVAVPIRCPSCGASIEIPKEGSWTKCRYCGQTIYIDEILKRI